MCVYVRVCVCGALCVERNVFVFFVSFYCVYFALLMFVHIVRVFVECLCMCRVCAYCVSLRVGVVGVYPFFLSGFACFLYLCFFVCLCVSNVYILCMCMSVGVGVCPSFVSSCL